MYLRLHLHKNILLSLGAKAKAIINQARKNVAQMVGGTAEDIIFTSGGTEVIFFLEISGIIDIFFESNNSIIHGPMAHHGLVFFQANNLVLHTAIEHFRRNCRAAEQGEGHHNGCNGLPHIITSNVEHDSIKLVAEHLQREGKAGRRRSLLKNPDFILTTKKKPLSIYSLSQPVLVSVFLSQMLHLCLCLRWQPV